MAENLARPKAALTTKAEAPAPDAETMASLVDVVKRSSPEAQSALRNALGVGGAIQKPKQTQSNADAKRVAYSVGEIVQPDGFEPKVSEAVTDRGPQAVAEWLEKWHLRNDNPSSKAEEYAAVAHM